MSVPSLSLSCSSHRISLLSKIQHTNYLKKNQCENKHMQNEIKHKISCPKSIKQCCNLKASSKHLEPYRHNIQRSIEDQKVENQVPRSLISDDNDLKLTYKQIKPTIKKNKISNHLSANIKSYEIFNNDQNSKIQMKIKKTIINSKNNIDSNIQNIAKQISPAPTKAKKNTYNDHSIENIVQYNVAAQYDPYFAHQSLKSIVNSHPDYGFHIKSTQFQQTNKSPCFKKVQQQCEWISEKTINNGIQTLRSDANNQKELSANKRANQNLTSIKLIEREQKKSIGTQNYQIASFTSIKQNQLALIVDKSKTHDKLYKSKKGIQVFSDKQMKCTSTRQYQTGNPQRNINEKSVIARYQETNESAQNINHDCHIGKQNIMGSRIHVNNQKRIDQSLKLMETKIFNEQLDSEISNLQSMAKQKNRECFDSLKTMDSLLKHYEVELQTSKIEKKQSIKQEMQVESSIVKQYECKNKSQNKYLDYILQKIRN